MNFYTNYNISPIYGAFVQKAYQTTAYSNLPKINQGPMQDVFQKSMPLIPEQKPVEINGASIINDTDRQKIQAIYDKTYDKVMAQNPITQELNIAKPQLDFDTKNGQESIATYDEATNEIEIGAKKLFTGDLYTAETQDGNGDTVNIFIFSEEDLKAFKQTHPNDIIKEEKLNESEKELYISSVFAHELRHCIQAHLIASTDNCANFQKEKITAIKQDTEELVKLEKEMAELKGETYTPSNSILEAIDKSKKMDYFLNYTPKKTFDEDMTLKYSLLPSDNRYFSIKNDFVVKSQECHKAYENDKSAYYKNPREIDAYNYEREFMLTQERNYPPNSIRSNVLHQMALMTSLSVRDYDAAFIVK